MGDRKRRAGRLRPKRYDEWQVGPHLFQATPREVARALARVPLALDWPSLRGGLLPIFPRRRPMPAEAPEPIRVSLPPGVLTGFGIDIGPAFLHVHQALLDGWPISIEELTERALANLAGRARRAKPRDVHEIDLEHSVVQSFQSHEGWASTLLLLPDELERLFGPEPQCFIAPLRDVLFSYPSDVDRAYLAAMNEEFAALDPNALALEAFVLEDGRLRCEPLLDAAVA